VIFCSQKIGILHSKKNLVGSLNKFLLVFSSYDIIEGGKTALLAVQTPIIIELWLLP
jgi:hypothetical protein